MKTKLLILISCILAPLLLEAQNGPGLGNLTYTSSELFKSIWKYTTPQHYGSNIAIMHNGYLVTTYTPDSGNPPGGIMIWNVSNPRSPVLVKNVFDNRTASLREAHSIGQHGNYIALQEGCGIQIWDLSNVQNPVLVKRFCIPGYAHDDYGSAWQLFWQAPYIYIGNGSSGLDVVDATDILNPVYVKHVNIGMPVGPLFAIGNLLVTGAHDIGKGYAILDISDPKNPKLLNKITNTDNIYSAFVNGNRIIGSSRFSSDDNSFSVYDFTDPFSIKLAGRVNIQNSGQLYCATQDQYIFQGLESEIVKIDASNVASMKVAGRGNLGISGDSDHGQVSPMGNLVFVGNDHGTGSGFIVHQLAPDTKGPSVNMVSPISGAINRALTSRIGMTFTDNIDLRTVNSNTFIVRPKGGAALNGIYSHQFSTVNFTPAQPLQPNTTYEIEIPAGGLKDWVGNATTTTFVSNFSTGSTIDNPDSPPAAPGGLTLKEENSKISLSWSSVAQATKYNVKRSTSATGPFNTLGTITTTTYVDQTVTNGTTYYYAVSAANASGEGSNSSVVQGVPQLYITDLAWVSSTNGYGPVEKDRSNGEAGSADGTTITIDGQQYSRGLGAHANSTVIYNLNQEYGRFVSAVGVDDEVGSGGSCTFEVYLDGVQKFTSGKVTGNDAKKIVDLVVSGVNELRLVVTDAGDGNVSDHASWGGPYLVKSTSVVVATVYKHCNYNTSGYAVGLQPDDYTLAQLQAKGISNNDISSIKIQSGYEIVLYNDNNFLGTSRVVKADIPCLTSIQFNDMTSSLKLRAITTNSRAINSPYESGVETEISIAPNPANEYIKFNNNQTAKVTIYSLQGYKVMNQAHLEIDGQLSVEDLPAGVYIVELQQGNTRAVHKTIFKK
jgi:hypothetical protein